MVPASGPAPASEFTEDEALLLARLEHQRGLAPRTAGGGGHGALGAAPGRGAGTGGRRCARHSRDAGPGGLPGAARRRPQRRRPGEAGFAPAEWAALQRAMMAAGVLVALAEGAADADEIYALVRTLREAGGQPPPWLIRELAASSAFEAGLRPGTGYEDYEGPALAAVRSAAAILVSEVPGELPCFRRFLAEVTAVVADANDEGGFFRLGAWPRTPAEAAAMDAVRKATELDSQRAGTLRAAAALVLYQVVRKRVVSAVPGDPDSHSPGARPW